MKSTPDPYRIILGLALVLSMEPQVVLSQNHPVISEFLADNRNGLRDEDAELHDWIEIFNPTSNDFHLTGWSLTDDSEDPEKWTFSETLLVPGEYLVVFASGKDRRDTGRNLHANFKLDRGGEFLALIDPAGRTVASILAEDKGRFPAQKPDVSFGIQGSGTRPGAPFRWMYFLEPTPGKANGDGVLGFVEDTKFGVDRGFYQEPFSLVITTDTAGAGIFYTTDGSPPDDRGGIPYLGPISIGRTTVIRARAYKEGWHPTNVDTHTYLFTRDIVLQSDRPAGWPNTWHTQAADYGMDSRILLDRRYGAMLEDALKSHPVIALSLPVKDLFDQQTGIYSNATRKGDAWERPVSVELFHFPHGQDIQVDAGLRMQGNASRSSNRPKHNMRLAFRKEYGVGTLDFPLFEGAQITRFNNLVLRGQNGDSWIHPSANQRQRAQYIRDQWHRDIQMEMGHETILQGHFHLYINGLYWGFYHGFERAEAEFMAEHFGGNEEDYDVVQDFNRQAGLVEAIDGNLDDWNTLMSTGGTRPESPSTFQNIQRYLNLDNFIDYMLLNFYSGNTDWDNGNWRAGHNRETGDGFLFFAWDSERTIGDSAQSNLVTSTDITNRNNVNRPTGLHQDLVVNPEYRLRFADRIRRHLFQGGALSPEKAAESWMRRVHEIRLPLIAEAARWGDAHRPGDPYSPSEEWQQEVDRLIQNYFPIRTGIVLNQLKNRSLFPNIPAVGFEPSSGTVAIGQRVQWVAEDLNGNRHPLPSGLCYYTTNGEDPRLPGGSVNPLAKRGDSVLIVETTILKSRIFQDGNWGSMTEAQYTVEPSETFDLAFARASGEPFGIIAYYTRPPDPMTALTSSHYEITGQPVAVHEVAFLNPQTVLLKVDPFDMNPMDLKVTNVFPDSGESKPSSPLQTSVQMKTSDPFEYGPLRWSKQPESVTVFEGENLRLECVAVGSSQDAIAYQWYRNDVLLEQGRTPIYELESVAPEDSGSRWFVRAFNDNGAFQPLTSQEVVLEVVADRFGPLVESLSAWSLINRIDLAFNETLNASTAVDVLNYRVEGVDIFDVTWQGDMDSISLFTGALTSGKNYKLTIRNVEDLKGNKTGFDHTIPFTAQPPDYADLVLLDDPVRYWRFDESANTSAVQSLVTGLDPLTAGTADLINQSELETDGLLISEPSNTGIRLNASQRQSLLIPNGSDININNGPWKNKSVEIWMRANRLPRLGETAMLYEQGAGTRALALYLFGTQNLSTPTMADLYWFAFNNSSSDGPGDGWGPAFGNAVFNRVSIAANSTYHVVGVMDGDETDALNGTLSLYLNGELKDRRSGIGQIYNHSGDVQLGYGNVRLHNNFNGNTGHFDGILDELALYNRSLTESQVRAHFQAGIQPRSESVSHLPPILQFDSHGGRLILQFNGVLESATALDGTWATYTETSPAIMEVASISEVRFWRARRHF